MAEQRSVHLVGSIPAGSASDAYRFVTDQLGDTIGPSLPDGATGARAEWVNHPIHAMTAHPDLELVRPGKESVASRKVFSDSPSPPAVPRYARYEDTPSFRVKPGHALRTIDLYHYAGFTASWKTYEDMVSASGRRYQVSIPSPLSVAGVVFGFRAALARRHLAPFRAATVREIGAIWGRGRNNVLFQLEVPVEVRVLAALPAPAWARAARLLAREALRIVDAAPRDSAFGLHVCIDDLNEDALLEPFDAGLAVALTNALIAAWPEGRTLAYVHLPFAHGKRPPTMDPAYYEPLHQLWVPEHVRLIAGISHEATTIDRLVLVRDQIEFNLGRRVDIAAACGLGHRSRDAARLNLDIARAVALAD
jgi:hypothetical protein